MKSLLDLKLQPFVYHHKNKEQFHNNYSVLIGIFISKQIVPCSLFSFLLPIPNHEFNENLFVTFQCNFSNKIHSSPPNDLELHDQIRVIKYAGPKRGIGKCSKAIMMLHRLRNQRVLRQKWDQNLSEVDLSFSFVISVKYTFSSHKYQPLLI